MSHGALTTLTSLLVALLSITPGRDAPQGSREAVRMAFFGDMGTGDERQAGVRDQLALVADGAGLDTVFTLGDNVYKNGEAKHIGPRFVDVYEGLIARGIPFRSALGNHDVQKCRTTEIDPLPRDSTAYESSSRCEVAQQLGRAEFGYPDGQRYYSITLGGTARLVEVFVLDSNTLANDQSKLEGRTDSPQLSWLDAALDSSDAVWKVVTMHHPMYGPTADRFLWAGHEADGDLRRQLEPLFEGRVDVVFQGHSHLYARALPQRGIRYFVAGGGGAKPYRFKPDPTTASRDDRGKFNHFVYVRASTEAFEYCVKDIEGETRDGGWFSKGQATDTAFPAGTCPILD